MLLFLFYYSVIPECETLNNTHHVLDSRFSSGPLACALSASRGQVYSNLWSCLDFKACSPH